MAIRRRQLLQYGGTGGLLAALPWQAGAAVGQLCHYVVDRARGVSVGVDAAVTVFAGDGLYLYPAWGNPRPYLVRLLPGGHLGFSNPEQPAELWRQSLEGENHFAGRLLPDTAFTPRQLAASPPLQVPVLPEA